MSTYKEIGKKLGNPNLARVVGNVLNENPYAPRVTCHCVVRSDGNIGDFARGAREKTKFLALEGVRAVNGKIDLEKFGFSPKRK